MRLIINKALNNTNDVVNLKIIELDSADLLDNTVDYFSYKYQIPLIKFTDTGEVFNIRNFKNRLDLSSTETELILTENDLELISGSGGGGSQDLQSVLDEGNSTTSNILMNYSEEGFTSSSNIGAGLITLNGEQGVDTFSVDIDASYISTIFNSTTMVALATNTDINNNRDGLITIGSYSGVSSNIRNNPSSTTTSTFYLPLNDETTANNRILATTNDIQAPLPTYADNASAITGGLVADNWYKTATGELRVVV